METNATNSVTMIFLFITALLFSLIEVSEMGRILLVWESCQKIFQQSFFESCFKYQLIAKGIFTSFILFISLSALLVSFFIVLSIEYFIEKLLYTFIYYNYIVFGPYMLVLSIFGLTNWDNLFYICQDLQSFEKNTLAKSRRDFNHSYRNFKSPLSNITSHSLLILDPNDSFSYHYSNKDSLNNSNHQKVSFLRENSGSFSYDFSRLYSDRSFFPGFYTQPEYTGNAGFLNNEQFERIYRHFNNQSYIKNYAKKANNLTLNYEKNLDSKFTQHRRIISVPNVCNLCLCLFISSAICFIMAFYESFEYFIDSVLHRRNGNPIIRYIFWKTVNYARYRDALRQRIRQNPRLSAQQNNDTSFQEIAIRNTLNTSNNILTQSFDTSPTNQDTLRTAYSSKNNDNEILRFIESESPKTKLFINENNNLQIKFHDNISEEEGMNFPALQRNTLSFKPYVNSLAKEEK